VAHDTDIASIRKDYIKADLTENAVGTCPMQFFSRWFDEAQAAEVDEVNAMTLATSDKEGVPHARIVLLKALEEEGFSFFTNYKSHKGQELDENPRAALVFFWQALERQVRIEGTVERLSDTASDTYFYSRPEGSQLGAWASPQSQEIIDRSILEDNYRKYQEQFSTHIPRPPHWGGFILKPNYIEFWQGRSNRMHDRIVFTLENNLWKRKRLAP
jgi:pyridoxamine 5'-phosphate oxidase